VFAKIGTTHLHPLTEHLLDLVDAYTVYTAKEYTGLWAQWDVFRSAMLAFMQDYDVLLGPVAAFPAPPHGFTFETETWKAHFSYAFSENLTGWPSVVVRAGTSPERLPIGVQVVARPWREDIALAVAQHIESVLGGWQMPELGIVSEM